MQLLFHQNSSSVGTYKTLPFVCNYIITDHRVLFESWKSFHFSNSKLNCLFDFWFFSIVLYKIYKMLCLRFHLNHPLQLNW